MIAGENFAVITMRLHYFLYSL